MKTKAIINQDAVRIIITDCGSTTTKALLFEQTAGSGWKQTVSGSAPTTVEAPIADVTVGVINAVRELEDISGYKLLDEKQQFIKQVSGDQGFNHYFSTSSAGGGLQMLVAGIVKDISAASAERAALGAGAILLDTISFDHPLENHELVAKIRAYKPDIVLLAGGTENGAVSQVLELAEIILVAAPQPRFGNNLKLPVIYAGNSAAAAAVEQLLSEVATTMQIPNVRPEYEREELALVRAAIHDLFLEHVMSHSPGYDKLLAWSDLPVEPTPSAVGKMVQAYAAEVGKNIIAVDIGGATTDIFSVFAHQGQRVFNRTVSANLGMSYSVANVLLQSGMDNITRWLSGQQIDQHTVEDRLRNKMVRPTSVPQTMEDLNFEQAICREALRLSLAHHIDLAVVTNKQSAAGIANIFQQKTSQQKIVDRKKLDLVIGSGGVLSHAPDRYQAALMMIDGFGLEGFTELAVDSIFMLPHLGLIAEFDPSAAMEILQEKCLIYLGQAIVPVNYGKRQFKPAEDILAISFDQKAEKYYQAGKIYREEIKNETTITVRVLVKGLYAGGESLTVREYTKTLQAGETGLIIDTRNVNTSA